MITRTKVLLGGACAALVAGTGISTNVVPPLLGPSSYVILPVGAILLGLFMVSRMLEKESVFFDKEHSGAAHGHPPKEPPSATR